MEQLRLNAPDLMTPSEVAKTLRVDPKTVTRWASQGRLPSIRTPGNHRRYRVSDIQALLNPEEGASNDAR